jgi:diphthine synthase
MLYIIGLGLNVDGISKFGLQAVKKCKKIYLENYTVTFPYEIKELVFVLKKKVIPADREKVEGLSLIDEAQKMDVALLVYGSPLTATTHITLLEEAKKSRVRTKVIYNASILDAVAITGLQLYKFGKVASMPAWKKSYEPDSFMKIVQENMSMKSHSLILVDPGLGIGDAIKQLEKASANHKIKLRKLVICQALGTRKQKILYRDIEEVRKFSGIKEPYSIIIPSKLHFMEKEVLKNFE